MRDLLEVHDICEAIENAFRPLECRVEIYDRGRRLALSVVDFAGELLLPSLVWQVRLLHKPHCLRARLLPLRDRVELEGYVLDPWNFGVPAVRDEHPTSRTSEALQ